MTGMRLCVSFWVVVALALRATVRAEPASPVPPPTPPASRSVVLGRELPVRDVVAMAERVARRSSPAKIAGLVRRARLSGAVPQLRLGIERGMAQDLSASNSLETARSNTSLDDDLRLEATLTFDLGRVVFASDEVRLLAVERWLVADRAKLIEEVIRLYFRRVTLLGELALAPDDPKARADLGEVEALLDAFTEGAFTRALVQLAPRDARAGPAPGPTSAP